MPYLGVTVVRGAGQVVEEPARLADRIAVGVQPPGGEVVGVGVRVAQTRELCAALSGLSLIDLDSAGGGRVRLHDVIRDFLRSGLDDQRLQDLHCALVDAAGADVVPADNLVTHLLAAGRTSEAEALALDLRWIAWRLDRRAATAPIADLAQIPTPAAQQAAGDLARTAHLLTPSTPARAQAAVLRSRLSGYSARHAQATAWRYFHPALYKRWPLPDLPEPAQRRTLTVAAVTVAISPDGTWLATTTSRDGTVRVWDAATGRMTRTLAGRTRPAYRVAISPDGTWLATVGLDQKLRVWDTATGRMTRTLAGRTRPAYRVAISPDGTWLAVIDYRTVRIRDVATGRTTRTLTSHGSWLYQLAISPDSTWLATAGADGTVQVSGHALFARWLNHRDPHDLNKAIEIFRRCITALAPNGEEPSLPALQLGQALAHRAELTDSAADRAEASSVLHSVATLATASSRTRFRAARYWLAVADSGTEDVLDGCRRLLELLSSTAWLATSRAAQESWLAEQRGIGSQAARLALDLGRPDTAVEFLEQGRGILWSQLLEARTDLTGITEADPELATRMVEVRDELEQLAPSLEDIRFADATPAAFADLAPPDPDRMEALKTSGDLVTRGNTGAAFAILDTLTDADDPLTIAAAESGRGNHLRQTGVIAGAKTAFAKAAATDAGGLAAIAAIALGDLFADEGDLAGARAAYEQAAGIDDDAAATALARLEELRD